MSLITAPPVFTDLFPSNIEIPDDYIGYVKHVSYKWVKIPIKIIDVKLNEPEFKNLNDFKNRTTPPILVNSDSIFNPFKYIRYIVYPYTPKSFKNKLMCYYKKRQLIYVAGAKMINDPLSNQYILILAQTILPENLKYSSKLHDFPYRIN